MSTRGSPIAHLLVTRAIRARHRFAIAASVTDLPALAGAAVSGASFVSDSKAGASTAMAVLTGIALVVLPGKPVRGAADGAATTGLIALTPTGVIRGSRTEIIGEIRSYQ